jgi:DNA-binding CsgD family transcriptional regulator
MTTAPDKSYVCPILVGRTTQLQAIDRLTQTAKMGETSAVLISGEAGIGKSRLLSEAVVRASANTFRVLKGDCFEGGRSLPYSAILEMLRTNLTQRSAEQIKGDLGPDATAIVELLPELASLNLADLPAAPSLDPEQEKRRLFHALLRVLFRLAGQQPLLAVVEDLHWSDETTLEFLQFLCRYPSGAAPSSRLLIVMTYRSDEVQPPLAHFLAELDRTRSAVELPLERLTAAETDVMTRAILDLHQPARRDFLEALHAVTNGNPFYVEEVIKTSLSRSPGTRLAFDAGSYQVDLERVPRTVQDALRQRLTLLSQPARGLLDVAAVSGMRLDIDLLRGLLDEDDHAFLLLLRELVAAQLIVEEREGFLFRHALTRQAVYTQLLSIERRELHRKIAETMERLHGESPEQLDMHVGGLAYHFYEAEAWDKALRYSERAGERADALSTPAAVVEHLSRARESARRMSLKPSSRTLRLLANAYEVLGEFQQAQAAMEAALEAALRDGDQSEQWRALIGLGVIWSPRDYDRAGEYWRDALALARDIGDETLVAHSLNRVGNWHLNVEQPVEAVRDHEEALRTFERLDDVGGIAETVDLLGMTWYLGADMRRSRAYYERSLLLFEQLHDNQGYTSSLSTLSVCAPVYHTDTLPPSVTVAEAKEWLERAHATARQLSWRAGEAYVSLNLGLALGPAGEYGRALDSALSAVAIAEEIGHLAWTSAALWTLGNIQLDILNLDAARSSLERAYATAQQTGSLHWRRCTAGSLARCYLRLGSHDLAKEVLEATLQLAGPPRTLGERTVQAARVELALDGEDPGTAQRLLAGLLETAALGGACPPRLGKLGGDALRLLGDRVGAEAAYRSAAEQAEAQNQRGLQWRIHAALSRLYRETGQRSRASEARHLATVLIDRLAESISDGTQRQAFLEAATAQLPPPLTPRQAATIAFGGLTQREREIAALIAGGSSNAAIAKELVVSERTVETHVTNILAKLGFSSRSQIAAWAVENGLITRT